MDMFPSQDELDAATAFTALALFNILRFPLVMFPMTINNVIEASVALQRIQEFLEAPELHKSAVRIIPRSRSSPSKQQRRRFDTEQIRRKKDTADVMAASGLGGKSFSSSLEVVKIVDATLSWGAEPKTDLNSTADRSVEGAKLKKSESTAAWAFGSPKAAAQRHHDQQVLDAALHNVTLSVYEGELLCVVGSVGSGKSSLLSAMLGEMELLRGDVARVAGQVALVGQSAFILNASVRENVVFGRDFDAELYEQVLDACCLGPDLAMLPAGDGTEIGEQGINISGGQRQRISLARAAYSQADLYLLDDPLSAVDAHVAKHIFERLVTGLLSDATRVLVTHGIQYLSSADHVALLKVRTV